MSFESAHFYDNNIIIAKECKRVHLFRLSAQIDSQDDNPFKELKWKKYHSIDISGFVSIDVDQSSFRIVNEKFIYSYNFNDPSVDDKYWPKHSYSMFNYFKCTHMQIGSKGQRCLVY